MLLTACTGTAHPTPPPYENATPERLAALMLDRLGAPVDYEPVESDGAAKVARLIAPLLDERRSTQRSFDVSRA